MGVLFVGSPAIHIQLHRSKCFPLEITYIDYFVFSTEDTVHIRTNVRLAGQTGTDIGRDVETDIFPDTACLVARPDSGIALRACPAIQRDDKWTGITAIIRHNMSYVRHSIQSEGITGSYPCHVSFQYTHAGITDFFHDITLQQGTYTFFRMQVRLCPEPYFHTVFAGIISETFQIGNIAVQCFRLSVSGSVTVIRK